MNPPKDTPLGPNNCDHRWGDGSDSYWQTRTVCKGFDIEGGTTVWVCDRCKAFIIHVEGRMLRVLS